jgi:hypothetical protein
MTRASLPPSGLSSFPSRLSRRLALVSSLLRDGLANLSRVRSLLSARGQLAGSC